MHKYFWLPQVDDSIFHQIESFAYVEFRLKNHSKTAVSSAASYFLQWMATMNYMVFRIHPKFVLFESIQLKILNQNLQLNIKYTNICLKIKKKDRESSLRRSTLAKPIDILMLDFNNYWKVRLILSNQFQALLWSRKAVGEMIILNSIEIV